MCDPILFLFFATMRREKRKFSFLIPFIPLYLIREIVTDQTKCVEMEEYSNSYHRIEKSFNVRYIIGFELKKRYEFELKKLN